VLRFRPLGNVFIGASFQPANDVTGVAPRRDQNDGHEGQIFIGFELAANLKAVHSRHHDIEQDQIR
jgi:hypothetical protein